MTPSPRRYTSCALSRYRIARCRGYGSYSTRSVRRPSSSHTSSRSGGLTVRMPHPLRSVRSSRDTRSRLSTAYVGSNRAWSLCTGWRHGIEHRREDRQTHRPFVSAPNLFEALAAHESLVEMSGSLRPRKDCDNVPICHHASASLRPRISFYSCTTLLVH